MQARQRGPDQVVETARVARRHQNCLARPHQLAHHAALQVRCPAPQLGRQPVQADQAQLVLLDQHEAARVSPGELAQTGSDPVQHSFQLELAVHVGDHVAQPPHDPGALGHIVPDRLIVAAAMAHADPAAEFAGAVQHPAGVDPHVHHRAVLAGSPGGKRHLAAAGYPLQHRVVLGPQLLRNEGRLEPHDLGSVPAEQPLSSGVPDADAPVRPDRDDGVGRALDDSAGRPVDPVAVPLSHRKLPPHWLMVAFLAVPRSVKCAKLLLAPRATIAVLCHHCSRQAGPAGAIAAAGRATFVSVSVRGNHQGSVHVQCA